MARDHLIPAVLLGQFAIPDDFAKRPRERGIYASTNNNRTTERRRVDKIGYGRRFYDHAPLPSGIVAGATWNARTRTAYPLRSRSWPGPAQSL